jgi:hypothetical protein
MHAKNNDEERFDFEDFQEALKRFAAKNKNCYSFLTKAGKDFQEAKKDPFTADMGDGRYP